MARPVKHDAQTREAVLDAAEALLAQGGPSAVTVRAVADRIGESTRAVYSQFGSMAGLMGALGARGFRMLADLVNGLPQTDDPLADLVDAGVLAFREFAIGRPQLFRITFHEISEAITQQPDAAPALRAAYDSLAARFQRAIDAGLLPPRPLPEYAFAFHSITSGLAANELSRQPPPVGANFWTVAAEVEAEQVWRMVLHAFVDGLTRLPRPITRRRSARSTRSPSSRRR
jgi:AcrR family transcriptional regulator